MQLKADGRHIASAIDSMLQSNTTAAELALTYEASAVTDVTGFGLLGHLLEMMDEALVIDLLPESLPVLAGAREALDAGIRSSMHEANLRSSGANLEVGDSVAAAPIVYDPQTSGGLLIGIAGAQAQSLCDELHRRGCTDAAVIGDVAGANLESGPRVRLVKAPVPVR